MANPAVLFYGLLARIQMKSTVVAMILLLAIPAAHALAIRISPDETLAETIGPNEDLVQLAPGAGSGEFTAVGLAVWVIELNLAAPVPDVDNVEPPVALQKVLTAADEYWKGACVAYEPPSLERRLELASAFGLQQPPESYAIEELACVDDPSKSLSVYSFRFTGASPAAGPSTNVPDVAWLVADYKCTQVDSNAGAGRTWKHNAELVGNIYSVVLQSHMPVNAALALAPGKCDPDGIEEDKLKAPTIGVILGVVPICGSLTFAPEVIQTVVDAGGASVKTHTGWNANGNFAVEIPFVTCGLFQELTNIPPPISAAFHCDFPIGA